MIIQISLQYSNTTRMNAEPVNYVTLTEEKATRINKSETDKIKTRFKKVVFGLSVNIF